MTDISYLLRPGLSVYFEKEIMGIHGHWMTIDAIKEGCIFGQTEGMNSVETSIPIDMVLRVCGDLHWNIQHLQVSCSKKLLQEKQIGYFINRMFERPDHYGRVFYALSEIDQDKSAIELVEVPLYVIEAMDRRIEPLLEQPCYYGCLLEKNAFNMLTESDIRHRDRSVYPSSIEIDTDFDIYLD